MYFCTTHGSKVIAEKGFYALSLNHKSYKSTLKFKMFVLVRPLLVYFFYSNPKVCQIPPEKHCIANIIIILLDTITLISL